MKRYLLLIVATLTSSALFAQPVITSFTPTAGPIATVVTITGTNFNAIAANNVVFFGAVRATVSAASAISLTVTVPIGTTYDPIVVTTLNNNLTAYSNQPFLVTFPGAGPVFTAASFNTRVDIATGTDPYGVSNIDFDNDGKPDLVTANYNGNSISVSKNTSIVNNVSYNAHVDYPTALLSEDVFAGDLDGDGKPDIAVVNWNSNSVSVFRNTSTTGFISFAAKVDFATPLSPQSVSIGDIDGDGKPDLVVTTVNSHFVSVLRNTGSAGIISFAASLNFTTGFNPYSVIIRDLDGDGKPDLAVAVNGTDKLAIFRNLSTPGTISFGVRIDYTAGDGPFWIAVGDLDGDGKPDIVVPNNQTTNLSVYRNTSTAGVISFDPKVDFFTGTYPQHISIGDLDGDGKPELALAGNDAFASIVSIYKNTCSVGNISFAPKVDYITAFGDYDIKLGDVDADGKPDLILSCRVNNLVSILTNNITACITATITTQPANSSICVGSSTSFTVSASNAVSYQWQENIGSGWNNLTNNATYSGTLTNTLTITGATIPMNNNQYRCVVTNSCSNINSSAATLTVISSGITSISIATASNTICAGSSVSFTATPVNGGSSPTFQWKKNGSNVGTNSVIYTDNTLVNGDIISCDLTSSATCLTTTTASSNNIVMTVNATQTPSVSISASANNICLGTTIIFTATPVYGGTTPSFQWTKNGVNTGTNSTIYSDNALNNGDIIKCILTSNYNCVTSSTATSNQVIMSITPLVTPSITISASANNICPGTLVIFSSVFTNGGASPIYQWKKNGIAVGTNSSSYSDNAIANGDIITCVFTSNANCLTTASVTSNGITMLLTTNTPVDLGPDKSVCSGSSLIINAQPGYASYLWQDGSTNSSYTVTTPGTYRVTVIDACGIISSDDILITLNPKPNGFLPADTSLCSNQSISITPNKSFLTYLWNTNAVSTSLNISLPGLYWLEVTDNNTCKGRDSIIVVQKNCLKGLYVPNAFTPDGDTKNDIFRPHLYGTVKQYSFVIFNRYGQVVFETNDLMKGWDGTIKGKAQNPGVYVWKCVYQIDNQLINSELGSVVLIR